ncbi:MAG: hypothetical protein NXI32_31230, partial [bacterium]|nr:hypothetical protein [bacterium]
GCNVWTPARTDRDRLQSRQLIYTGLERTPVSAILPEVELDGQRCPLMAERFADSGDAYRVLGEMAEDSDNCDTADGRSRTRVNSAARLARMVGEDLETLGSEQVRCLALQIVEAQLQQILEGVHSNLKGMANSLGLGDCQNKLMTIVLCGHGKPILDRIRKRLSDSQLRITDLQNWVGESVSRCAPAMSVASLLSSHLAKESQVR